MKTWWLGLGALLLSGCAASGEAGQPQPGAPAGEALPDYGPAPELAGSTWLNRAGPLRLADLRGKVVLIDFWTFGCVNCQNVIPSLKDWHARYGPEGLVVIGDHYPEFAYEADLQNLTAAIGRLGVPYLVVQDNDGATWDAYRVRFWPTLFLIDKRGRVRYTHIGEGQYAETEAAIRALLAEAYPQGD